MVSGPGHPSRSALSTPPLSRPAESQPNRQPATVCAESWSGEARQRVGRRRGRLTSGARQSLRALVMQSSAHPGHSPHGTVRWATEDSISQCPFLQMTYTAENPHADGSTSTSSRPRYQPPSHRKLPATSRTHYNWMAARQTSCRQQTAPAQPRCIKDVTAHPHWPGARPGSPCPVPACIWQLPSGRSGYSSPF